MDMDDISNAVPSDLNNALSKLADAENMIEAGKDHLSSAIQDMSLALTRNFKNSHLVV